MRTEANGLGEPKEILGPDPALRQVTAVGSDIVVARMDDRTGFDLYAVDAKGTLQPYLVTPANESEPQLSPDGSRLAYISDAAGTPQLWVAGFPDPGEPVRLSVGHADHARWDQRGDQIVFDDAVGRTASRGTLWSVAVNRAVPHGRNAYGAPVRLFSSDDVAEPLSLFGSRPWDVAADGKRVLLDSPYPNERGRTPSRGT